MAKLDCKCRYCGVCAEGFRILYARCCHSIKILMCTSVLGIFLLVARVRELKVRIESWKCRNDVENPQSEKRLPPPPPPPLPPPPSPPSLTIPATMILSMSSSATRHPKSESPDTNPSSEPSPPPHHQFPDPHSSLHPPYLAPRPSTQLPNHRIQCQMDPPMMTTTRNPSDS